MIRFAGHLLSLVLSWGVLAPQAAASAVEAGIVGRERGEVFIVHDAKALDGFEPRPNRLETMIAKGLAAATGEVDPSKAWGRLVTADDVVGIKVFSSPGAVVGTRRAVAAAIVKSLLEAGIPGDHIVIWDRRLGDLRRAGYGELAERLGVEVAGATESGYDSEAFYESHFLGKRIWSDLDFGKEGEDAGKRSYVTRLLTERLTKVIQASPLLNHNTAGVSGNLYGMAMASVDNTLRFESPKTMATAVPEIYAMPEVGDRVVLNIVDALICQYQGEEEVRLHQSARLNELRFSFDPVALDVLSILEIRRQREAASVPGRPLSMDLYANAALLELGVSDPGGIEAIRLE